MLEKMSTKHNAKVWLLNTGWSGGKYGVGDRMSLKMTRTILNAIHDGELDTCDVEVMPGFNLQIPKEISGVDKYMLNPVNTWEDKDAYKAQTNKLAAQFIRNMKKYEDQTPKEVVEKGGPQLY